MERVNLIDVIAGSDILPSPYTDKPKIKGFVKYSGGLVEKLMQGRSIQCDWNGETLTLNKKSLCRALGDAYKNHGVTKASALQEMEAIIADSSSPPVSLELLISRILLRLDVSPKTDLRDEVQSLQADLKAKLGDDRFSFPSIAHFLDTELKGLETSALRAIRQELKTAERYIQSFSKNKKVFEQAQQDALRIACYTDNAELCNWVQSAQLKAPPTMWDLKKSFRPYIQSVDKQILELTQKTSQEVLRYRDIIAARADSKIQSGATSQEKALLEIKQEIQTLKLEGLPLNESIDLIESLLIKQKDLVNLLMFRRGQADTEERMRDLIKADDLPTNHKSAINKYFTAIESTEAPLVPYITKVTELQDDCKSIQENYEKWKMLGSRFAVLREDFENLALDPNDNTAKELKKFTDTPLPETMPASLTQIQAIDSRIAEKAGTVAAIKAARAGAERLEITETGDAKGAQFTEQLQKNKLKKCQKDLEKAIAKSADEAVFSEIGERVAIVMKAYPKLCIDRKVSPFVPLGSPNLKGSPSLKAFTTPIIESARDNSALINVFRELHSKTSSPHERAVHQEILDAVGASTGKCLTRLFVELESASESNPLSPDHRDLITTLVGEFVSTLSSNTTKAPDQLLGLSLITNGIRVSDAAKEQLIESFKLSIQKAPNKAELLELITCTVHYQSRLNASSSRLPFLKHLAAALDLDLSSLKKPETHLDSHQMPIIVAAGTQTAMNQASSNLGSPVKLVTQTLRLGLAKLHKTHHGETVNPLYLGNEWQHQALSADAFVEVMDELRQLSEDFPGITIIPGSIAWAQEVDNHPTYVGFNTMPTFCDGKLVSLYHKEHEKYDLSTLAAFLGTRRPNVKWATTAPEYQESLKAINTHTALLPNGKVLVQEICNDHIQQAGKRDYERRAPTGTGADLHVMMAHGSQPRTETLVGKRFVYVDHSEDNHTQSFRIEQGENQRVRKDEQATHFQCRSAAGGLSTQIAGGEAEEKPSYRDYSPELQAKAASKKSISGLFEAIAAQDGSRSAEEVKQKLMDFINLNVDELCPTNTYTPSHDWSRSDSASKFIRRLQLRYTFSSRLEVRKFLNNLYSDKEVDLPVDTVLKLTSLAIGKPLHCHFDLSSLPDKDYDGDKAPFEGEPKALEIAYSFKEDTFSVVNIKKNPDYLTAHEELKRLQSGVDTLRSEALAHPGGSPEFLQALENLRQAGREFNGRLEQYRTSESVAERVAVRGFKPSSLT